jgi:hypothetical protein
MSFDIHLTASSLPFILDPLFARSNPKMSWEAAGKRPQKGCQYNQVMKKLPIKIRDIR